MKVVPESGDYFRISSPPKNVSNYIKRSIQSIDKYYDEGWCVHQSHVVDVCCLGYAKGAHVDYSELPLFLQMEIASQKKETRRTQAPITPSRTPAISECYAILHLLPSAPMDIVNAAWKVLAKKHHPDAGGNEETFKTVTSAYERIKKQHE